MTQCYAHPIIARVLLNKRQTRHRAQIVERKGSCRASRRCARIDSGSIRRRDPRQARILEEWLRSLSTDFAERLLPVDERVADPWGRLGLRQPVPTLDAFLAATALVHDLTIVSRDEHGFRHTGVRIVNPFSGPKPAGH